VSEPLRVVIADDHAPTRAGVRAALLGDGFVVCAELDNATDAIAAAKEHKPDVALLDIRMPGNGIAAAAAISAALPDTAVVMLTVSQADADLFDALKAGARGYLLKDIDPSRLPMALRGVLDGEAAIPRTLAARLMEEFRRRESRGRVPLLGKRRVELSEREYETLELLRQGLTTGETAARLFVTPATVRSHVSAIVRKLQVNSRAEAVALLRAED
jgi:DNA-binding NarL/FixJ family response regulator